LTVFPNLTINDLNAVNIGPDPNAPQGTIQNTYQGSESIIWNKGRHTFKIGAEYRDVISPQLFVQRAGARRHGFASQAGAHRLGAARHLLQ
jgi:hypothetical protein